MTDARAIAEEIAEAFAPLLADVFAGRTQPVIAKDALEGVLKIIGGHLIEANAAVLLADFRAAERGVCGLIEWIVAHAEPLNSDAFDTKGSG